MSFPSFRAGARAGFNDYLALSLALVPWSLVTGMAMVAAGLTTAQAIGMNVIVFAATAQLGTAPLLAVHAPLWLVLLTALALNLRFVIFSAALAPGFRETPIPFRWLSGYLLTDGIFATCAPRLLAETDRHWRMGYYIAPALWSWLVWQLSCITGILAATMIPARWSLGFMATIALIQILVPMTRVRPMLVAAAVGGASAIALRGLPLRLGVIVAIIAGITAGFLAEGKAGEAAP